MIESRKIAADIDGVWLQPLAAIPAAGGPVLHFLKTGYALAPAESRFGEIYFSEVLRGEIKAWKRHRRQTQLFAVPIGLIQIAVYDVRENSPTSGALFQTLLGRPDNYSLLSIPPGVWYGFRALGAGSALVCNCADIPHDPAESEKIAADSDLIPFSWS